MVQDTSVAGEVEGDNSLVSVEADDVVDFPGREMDVKADEKTNDVSYNHINLEVPFLVHDTDRALFKQQILEDRMLKTWRELGDRRERGYEWADDILTHKMVDEAEGVVEKIVVPQPRRSKLLQVSHDKLCHLDIEKL